jgi:hypothetical protein
MAKRACKKNPKLKKHMHPKLGNHFHQLTKGLQLSHLDPTKRAIISQQDDTLDRVTLFKIILDDMKGYRNNGSELIKDIRTLVSTLWTPSWMRWPMRWWR